MGKNWKARAAAKRAAAEGRPPPDKKPKKSGEGEYPPPYVLENAKFESYYREQAIVPDCEWDAFMGALRKPLGVSFRITGHEDEPTARSLRALIERKAAHELSGIVVDGEAIPPPRPISWMPGRSAWRYEVSRAVLRGKGVRKNPVEAESSAAKAGEPAGDGAPVAAEAASASAPAERADAASLASLAAFHAFLNDEVELGNISRQEEVSMVPPQLLGARPGHRVLDMCAAPGSKTQQLMEALAGATADRGGGGGDDGAGFVVANDNDYRRCHLLVHQAKRLASPQLVVTHHDATTLPSRLGENLGSRRAERLSFDRILCDVPCSGDGTLRKAPDLWRRWDDGLAWGVHRLQLSILMRGLELLVPGGRLVYSTCSLDPARARCCRYWCGGRSWCGQRCCRWR